MSPASFRPWRNARTRSALPSADAECRNPIVGALGCCCARAASGHAAAPPMSDMNSRRLIWSVCPFRRRVDHFADLSNLRCRKAADLRVLPDDVLIFSEINAKRLIVCDVAFDPLDIRAKLAQYPIRFLCCSTELFALEGADLGNFPFDYKLAQCHIFSPLQKPPAPSLDQRPSVRRAIGTPCGEP